MGSSGVIEKTDRLSPSPLLPDLFYMTERFFILLFCDLCHLSTFQLRKGPGYWIMMGRKVQSHRGLATNVKALKLKQLQQRVAVHCGGKEAFFAHLAMALTLSLCKRLPTTIRRERGTLANKWDPISDEVSFCYCAILKFYLASFLSPLSSPPTHNDVPTIPPVSGLHGIHLAH